jgi:hypothetical protein
MGVTAPRKPRTPGRSREPRGPGDPGAPEPTGPEFWACPDCIYRIALDFPSGYKDAVAAHRLAHDYPVKGSSYGEMAGAPRGSGR